MNITTADTILHEAYLDGPDDLERDTVHNALGTLDSSEERSVLHLGGHVLVMRDALDEDGRPFRGYEWSTYEQAGDGEGWEPVWDAQYAETADEARAAISRWITWVTE